MNWLTKITPPGVKNIFTKKDSPDNLWVKCPKSGEMVFSADLPGLLHVTPAGHHMRIGPDMRMDYTFDNAEYTEVAIPDVAKDPLKFKDDQKYTDRLKKARAKTGDQDAMNIGVGKIRGIDTVVLVQNFAFMGGSLGMAAGEGFISAALCKKCAKRAYLISLFSVTRQRAASRRAMLCLATYIWPNQAR